MKFSRDNEKSTNAFTLIEVLMAVMIFAVVLAAINTVFFSALHLRNTSNKAMEASLPIQQALTILKRDLENIVPPGGTLFGPFQSSSSSGTTTTIMPGQISPTFYTTTAQLDDTAPWGEVQKVYYGLTDSTNRGNGKDLFRAVTQNLLPVLVDDQPVQQRLMSGVDKITFYFFDGTQWRETWDSTIPDTTTGATNMLPQAIKVEIQLAAEESARRGPSGSPIDLVVPMTLQGRTNQTQSATGASL
jgi:type II secretion system protein J